MNTEWTDRAVAQGPDEVVKLCAALEKECQRLKSRDLSRLPRFVRPDDNDVWYPGDVPYSDSTDFAEFTVKQLKLVRARSFRADLLHKLNVIRRWLKWWHVVAKALKVDKRTLIAWHQGKQWPLLSHLRRVDATYDLAIESMLLAKRQRKKRT